MKTIAYGLTVLISGAIAITAAAQEDAIEQSIPSALKPWTHLDVNNDADSFQFAIITDRTGGHRPGVFMDAVRKLNLMQPEFVVSVGDLIEGYTTDIELLATQWNEFNGFVEQLEMPFFYVPGNHDISNKVQEAQWLMRFGQLWYHFKYKNVLFLCLDSEDPPVSHISQRQIEYVRKTLEENQDVRWTLVFIHKPLWASSDANENGWAQVEELLKGRPHSVYAGHTHHYYKRERNDMEYIVLATAGGASRMRGPNFGEFDHFMWVTMTDKGPRMANLMLDGVWDTDVFTEERANLLRPLLSGAAVKTDGVIFDRPIFDRASTTLRLTNDADLPMNIDLTIRQEEWLGTSVTRLSRVVAPNSVETVPLELIAPAPIPVHDLRPLHVNWNITYEVEDDLTPIEISGTHRIVIDSHYDALPVAEAITLDGKLGDWPRMTVRPAEPGQLVDDKGAWKDNSDGSVDFAVAYDSEYLYVAIDATDDQIVKSARPDYARQDHVQIYLDARPENERGTPGARFDDHLFIVSLAGKGFPDRFEIERLPDGVRVRSVITDDGYQTEIAVPLAYITERQGVDWQSVRINVALNDIDSDGRAQFWWRPNWSTPASYAGSGTFVRR